MAIVLIPVSVTVVGIFMTIAGNYLYAPRPRHGQVRAPSFAEMWRKELVPVRQNRALKESRQEGLESYLIDHDHQSVSILFRKLHHLEDQLRSQQRTTSSLSLDSKMLRRSLIDEYNKTKLLIASKLKASDKNVGTQNANCDDQDHAKAVRAQPAPVPRVIRIALCSFPLAEQMKGVKFDPPVQNRSLIIVLANMRTGSSFFGKLLERSNDVMYFYEPLKGLDSRAAKENVTGSDFEQMQLQLLLSISMCNFGTNMGRLLLQDISMSSFSSRSISQTFISPPLCPDECERKVFCPILESHAVNQVCLSKKATVIKTIRISDIRTLKPLTTNLDDQNQVAMGSSPARIKIAHLVRDPRAVVFSKMQMKGLLERDYALKHGKVSHPKSKGDLIDSSAQSLCDVMWTNLQHAATHPYWLKGNYHIFRFEDIAVSARSSVRDLYDHFGLTVTQSVLDWIDENTQIDANVKSFERRNPYGTARDSEMVVKAWRVLLDTPDGRSLVKIIETRCQHVMNFLGYKFEDNQFVSLENR